MRFQLTTGQDAPPAGPRVDDGPTLSYLAITRSDAAQAPAVAVRHDRLVGVTANMVLQDRYRLDAELGRGGFGVVFLAHDLRLGREVAVKVILPEWLASQHGAAQQVETLFADEARLAASMHHPGIATIHDYGFHDGLPYMVFEYVPGESFRERLRRRPRWPIEEVRQCVLPIAEALDYAHGRRVVHRDLKPENLRVTNQGVVKVLDLGLARQFDRTSDWCFAGTPAYASPEQAAELPTDGRTDQYALALIAYEMLTGSRPFHSHDVLALLEQQRTLPPPHPRQFVPEISERVAAALLRALSKDPAQRFASCKEFAAAIGCALPEGALLEPEILLEANVYARTRLILALGQAHLLLTRDVLWICRGDEVREVPIAAIDRVQPLWGGRTLEIRFRTEAGRGELRQYDFPSARQRDQWHAGLEQTTAPGGLTRHDVVAKRRGKPMPIGPQPSDIRYQVLGHLTATGRNVASCKAGLRIRARMLDADSVILADSVDQRWANATYSEDTRRALERHRLIRSTIGSPFGAIRPVVQRLSGLAGQLGADEPSTERLSGIAVRAVNPGERLALAVSGLRPEVAKLGIWMLAALVVWFFLARTWPMHDLRGNTNRLSWNSLPWVQGTRSTVATYVIPSLVQRGLEWPLAAWPLFIALVLCVRKSGQAVAKSAVTFGAWGTTRGAYLLLAATGERLVLGRTWLGLVLHVVLACVLLLIGIAAWRVARRFHRIVGVDGSSKLSRLDLGAWLFTSLFVLYCTRVFFGYAR